MKSNHRKKKKLDYNRKNTVIHSKQSPIIRYSAYGLILLEIASFIILVIETDWKSDEGGSGVIIVFLLIVFFFLLPYRVLRNKRQLTIQNDHLIITSNKGKNIVINLNRIKWWHELDPIPSMYDFTNKIRLRTGSRTIILDAAEFTNFSAIRSYFRIELPHKLRSPNHYID